MVRVDFPKKVTFEQKFEGGEGARLSGGKTLRQISLCKGPEAGARLGCLRNSKEATVAELG